MLFDINGLPYFEIKSGFDANWSAYKALEVIV